ncbi:Histone-lysine N-methyltransferase, H3 lysine-79 specific [Rhodotorula toruloides ATCC 204091]|uniref:Histone-lysine N-methyltransferase, H3 lysine-79 specific n=1 Tax=Rhodotorula toruloides TaxID=5286 RepID=A0A0K3CBZ1_RHOTO|nr:Histone-lysine N-methyltransferase, H3 lysine-79 specific [Rhodotorula toruloides ATCC 204091]PRQ74177.1 S-adenosyl-L-methionine-dependent methyltransferase [Rhodotorula toruloides]
MFTNSRPLPKSATSSSTPSRPVPTITVKPKISVVPPPSSPLSSIASSSASSPANASNGSSTASNKPRIQLTTKKVTVVKSVAQPPPASTAPGQPRSINKYPAPAPKPKEVKEKAKKKKGMLRGLSSDEDEVESEEERPRKKVKKGSSSSSASSASGKGRLKVNGTNGSRAASPLRQQHSSTSNGTLRSSSPLSSLPSTSSDEEETESELSSVDEDYFARTLKREDGGAIAVRDPSAKALPEGAIAELGRSGEWLVVNNRGAYRDYFVDLTDPGRPVTEWAGSEIPTVELELPGDGAKERFALLAPKSDDEYNPIEDVMSTVLAVLDHFLTPEQASHYFGHSPGKTSFGAFLYNRSTSNSRSGTPSAFSVPEKLATRPSSTTSLAPSPAPSAAADSPLPFTLDFALLATSTPPPASTPEIDRTPLIRQLEKARAKRDGPSFLAALARYNSTLSTLKSTGLIRANIAAMKGLKEKVWTKVFQQCYDRAVGPGIEDLRKYEAFSDNVYGELLPKFMNQIFDKTHLGPNSVFVDLGSGVGNCVVQAALATGATSYGFENMPHASSLARDQLAEAEKRFRMWGLGGGPMKVVEADFCEYPEVMQVLRTASVVLVNNEVFTSTLNQRLSWLFLELPDTCKIVSLKPFLPPNFSLSAHNANSPLAIINQGPALHYGPGSVSWKEGGGSFFVSRVDRARVQRWLEREGKREREKERKRAERGSSRGSSVAMSRNGSAAGK